MSKERLEEIKTKVNNTYDSMLYVPYEDIAFLIEQAELVQELEEENESVDWDLYKCERRLKEADEIIEDFEKCEKKKIKTLNRTVTKLTQQNKRYREAIEKAIENRAWGSNTATNILIDALESEEDGK